MDSRNLLEPTQLQLKNKTFSCTKGDLTYMINYCKQIQV